MEPLERGDAAVGVVAGGTVQDHTTTARYGTVGAGVGLGWVQDLLAEIVVTVADSEVHLDGLERSRGVVADAIGSVMGTIVQVVYQTVGRGGSDAVTPAEPERMDRNRDREERLRTYRSKDAALDAMAEALDLELLE